MNKHEPRIGDVVEYTTLDGIQVPAMVTAIVNSLGAVDLDIRYPKTVAEDPIPEGHNPELICYLPSNEPKPGRWQVRK